MKRLLQLVLFISMIPALLYAQRPIKVLGPGEGSANFRVPFVQPSGSVRTLSRDTVYVLTGWYFVDSTAKMVIPAGTLVLGDSASGGTLVIRRGGKIIADGTPSQPIVFTSRKAPGTRRPGDWGGVLILGNAPTNKPTTQQIEGGFGTIPNTDAMYGGSNPDDSSGVFRYVRIEFAGIAFATDNEINGLTLGGVGRKTAIDHVQVSFANDDDFEFFGGTVEAKYLVGWRSLDDCFDTDFGFSGKLQFIYDKRDPNIFDASASGSSNGFESDNEGSAPYSATPRTSARISNATIIGPAVDSTAALALNAKWGLTSMLRRATELSIYNSALVGWKDGITLRDTLTQRAAVDGRLQIRNTSIAAPRNVLTLSSSPATGNIPGFDINSWFTTSAERPTKVLGPGEGSANFRVPFVQPAGSVRTLSRDTVYILTGWYFVDSTAKITIPAGTLVVGDSASGGTLIVRRGAKIVATGTAAQPIVFTSRKAPGTRRPGDWGGVLILGNAPTNKPTTQQIEGGFGTIPNTDAMYGGPNADDSSGVFRYVRIEFAGIAFATDNEINGLTLGGVGRKTAIDHVQVSFANDDDFEFFGGTVEAKYLIGWRSLDDCFDTDFGFSGKLQFIYDKRDPNIFDASASGSSNGFESDNEGSAPYSATPRTSVRISNATIIGPAVDSIAALALNAKWGLTSMLRRATELSIYNSALAGWKDGITLRDTLTQRAAVDGRLQIRNTSIAAPRNMLTLSSSPSTPNISGLDPVAWYTTGTNNRGATARQSLDLGITSGAFNLDLANNPVPSTTSELATAGTAFDGRLTGDTWFTPVSYRGAFDPALSRSQQWDWGWANYDPQNTNYLSSTGNRGGVARQSLDVGLTAAAFTLDAANNPVPTVGSELATAGTAFDGRLSGDTWFTPTAYRGAFDPWLPRNQQWDASWTNYDPQNTNYVTSVRETGETTAPGSFSLEQNYPNPFNPTTNIRFEIPVNAFVTLKVYNVLGQEVTTLVNEQLSAGSFVADFNASNLASGTYIYRLTAGSTVQTRKMILMK